MLTLNDAFHEIVCINLDSRPDRWADCRRVFARHALQVTRIQAFDGKLFHLGATLQQRFLDDPTMTGVVGCNLSHLFAVKYAQQRNLRNVLILEDDVEFRDDLAECFDRSARELPTDWDLLYFSGSHRKPPTKVSEHIYRLHESVATHAYAVNARAYNAVLGALGTLTSAPDTNYLPLQPALKVYLTVPHLAWQRPGYSDLMNEFRDNSFLKDF